MGSIGGNAGNIDSVRSIMDNDKSVLSLPEDLVYGTDTGRQELPQTVQDFEKKRRTNKIEYSILTMNDGIVVSENKGGKGSVGAPTADREVADILSHNHPREPGVIGGTFSNGDIDNFVKFNQTTYRAVAKEGTYSITKGADFNGVALNHDYEMHSKQSRVEYNKVNKPAKEEYHQRHEEIGKQLMKGKISYDEAKKQNDQAYAEYLKKQTDAFNSFLLRGHNWLRENQKKYGYTYALER